VNDRLQNSDWVSTRPHIQLLWGNHMTDKDNAQVGVRSAPVGGRRVQGLDTIRGLAILLVLLRHAWPEVFGTAGIVGVVVFFALSGYLITGLLVRDIRDFGGVRFRRFYLHRFFRLMPALVFMLAGFGVVEGVWNILGDRALIGQSLLVGLTYTMNVPGIDHGSGALSHLWTLATEEQFYLLWPLVLMLAVVRSKASALTLVSIFGALALCAVSIFVVYPDTFKIYSLPTSWVSSMLIGSAAKLMEVRLDRLLNGTRSRLTALLALLLLLAISFAPEAKNWPGTYLILCPLISLAAVAVIFCCKSWYQLPSPALIPFHWLGKMSYAAYLWNYPIANWIGDRPLSLALGAASIILTLLAATASWYLVEQPSSALRRWFDQRNTYREPNKSKRVNAVG
jgi:peptidoglycan/LPS O-acetylase OafA/YrhL